MSITQRSKIAVRWTTDPEALGYASTQRLAESACRKHLASKPDYIGSPNTALAYADGKRRVHTGTMMRFDFAVCSTGELVDEISLRDLVSEHQYRMDAKRRG